MRRILLRGKPRDRLRAGEQSTWTIIVADDMGNSVGHHGEAIDLEVAVLVPARGGLANDDISILMGPDTRTRELSSSAGDFRLSGRGLVKQQEGAGDGAPQPIIRLHPHAQDETVCCITIDFREGLHASCTLIAVTFSSPQSSATVPLTIGPVTLAPAEAPRAPIASAPWTRLLRRSSAPSLTLRLLEENAADSGIAGSLWDAGLVLGAYLARHVVPQISAGQLLGPGMAVELGSGTGCAGLLVASALKEQLAGLGEGHSLMASSGSAAGTVLLTDVDQEGLKLAEQNIRLNDLPWYVGVSRLCWGDGLPAGLLGRGRPALVFAADVVYDEERFAPLVSTLSQLCGRGDEDREGRAGDTACQVLLAYRLRTDAKTAEHFWHLLAERFDVAPAVPHETVKDCLGEWGLADGQRGHAVSIYRLTPVDGAERPTQCVYCRCMLLRRQR